jgi:hypothetical protein
MSDDFDDLPSRRDRRNEDLPSRRARRDVDRSYQDEDDVSGPPRRRRRQSGSTLWVWAVLASVLVFCVLPCGGIVIWGAILAFPTFQSYDAPDGKFRAEFPGQPFTYTTKTREGFDRHMVEFKRNIPTETYFVHYTDLPQRDRRTPEQILQEAADQAVANIAGGTDLGRTSQTYDGYRAENVDIAHADDEGKTLLRFILAGRRLYTVGISCEQGIERHDPRAQHFFEAFKVKSADEAGRK